MRAASGRGRAARFGPACRGLSARACVPGARLSVADYRHRAQRAPRAPTRWIALPYAGLTDMNW